MNLENIYWLFKFGIPKRKISTYELRSTGFKGMPPPVFFLSTGRCGTKWFSKLLRYDKTCRVFHSPVPNMAAQGKKVYEFLGQNYQNEAALDEIFLSGREEYLRYSYKTNKRIIETNNGITFFAPIIAKLFPDVKFVHLIRDKEQFVDSVFFRGYYNGTIKDLRRLTPPEHITSRIEKIAWLWDVTNMFIDKFKSDNCMKINLGNLSLKSVKQLLKFLDITISDRRIKKQLKRRYNVQKR